MLNDKAILVTGGTGSFGQKFAEIILKRYKVKKLIVFSRDEMKQYEMRKRFQHECIRYFIGDVRDVDRLHRAFNGIDIVVHAAALKIVPTAEHDPFEAVKTNVMGAENVINVALDNGVEKVLALSTDKAVNPVNLYGATKLCAEKMMVAANNYAGGKKSRFSVVRYGNVFGSRGSVIPFFKECRAKGEVPITDTRMTRFWISLEQGVDFVLKCIEEMRGGEVFIPKLPSMKIVDLAKAVCPDCKQKIIGIRPGEKLHETLLASDDGIDSYEYDDKYILYSKVALGARKLAGKTLGIDFPGYRSDNNTRWLTVADLKRMADLG
jgi:UDP-N-acetylglucosamine 4,6-dehydratase/5-epimerase